MTSRTLVTGVTGQDGGYLAERLVADGVEVHGTVQPGERPPEHLRALGDSVVLHDLDLTDGPRLQQVLRDVVPHDVVNLAGFSSVVESWNHPILTAQVNGLAVSQLLDLLWQQQESSGNPVQFLQASSAEIFAGTSQSPQNELTPLAPASPYGAAKAFAHQLVQVYRARGLHASSVILYNHESPRRPPSFVTRKITSTVASIARGESRELVLGNLDACRDWGWAPEYVDAMVRVLRHPHPLDVVLATGVTHRVAEFVAAAFAHVGITDCSALVRSEASFTRPVEATQLVGDASRARELLGWTPQVSFQELVGRMVDADLHAPTIDRTTR